MKKFINQPFWTKAVLLAAAVYNLVWGLWVIFWPKALFQWLDLEVPNYLPIWQAVGMIVGVYGIGYAIAATNPYRYWPLVFVGLLGKILGPVGLVVSLINGSLSPAFFWQILLNDLIWWIPFGLLLIHIFHRNSRPEVGKVIWDPIPEDIYTARQAFEKMQSQMGQTLSEISQRKPVMLIFLRQSGCTFCRRTLSDLQKNRDQILAAGVEVAIVHMGTPMEGTMMLSKYDLDFFHRFSDPDCLLYRFFGFERGRISQVLNPKVIFTGLKEALLGGHGMGAVKGDSFQLPGVVVMHNKKSILALHANDAADRFDYLELAKRAQAIVSQNAEFRAGELVR